MSKNLPALQPKQTSLLATTAAILGVFVVLIKKRMR